MKTHVSALIYIIALCFLPFSAVMASSAHLFMSDQMTSSLVKRLCQDSYGFIWEGTEYGLNRFDGYRFVTYYFDRNDTTTIPGNEISSLLAGKDGSLWVGTSSGLAQYDYKQNRFVRFRFPNDIHPRVSTLIFDREGNLLVGTAGYGLFRVRKGGQTIEKRLTFRKGIDDFYSVLYIDSRNQLWRYSSQSGLTCLSSYQAFGNAMGQVRAFLPQGDGGFLVVASKGIMRYDFRSRRLSDAGFDLEPLGKGFSIQSGKLCRNGDILVGTTGRGVWKVARASKRAESLDITVGAFSLPMSSVNDILEDRSGNFWFNCYKKGLLLVGDEMSAFHLWSLASHNVITGSSISSISQYSGGVLGILPSKGLFRFDGQGQFKGFLDAPSGLQVVYTDKQGTVWLASGGTLYKYNVANGSAQKMLSLPAPYSINNIADDGKGHYYMSCIGHGIVVFDSSDHTVSYVSMNDSHRRGGTLVNDWVVDMLVDNHGLLWLCTADGVSCMDTRTGSFLSQGWKVLLEGSSCYAVAALPDDKVVIGTANSLYLYDRKSRRAEIFPHSEQLNDKSIRAIVADRSGDLWISTMNGIWQYSRKSGSFIGHISGNGLATREYSAQQSFCTGDLIGFGTPYGITVFNPNDVRHGVVPHGEVHLTSVIIGGREVGCMSDSYDVANGQNSLSMSFSLLDFRNTDNIIFQYRINGGEWTETDNYSNIVTFNRMRYGKYTLEVRALSNGQALNGVKKILISVAPPWYLTDDAFVAYALALIAIVAAIFIYYNRRKNRELEEAKMRFLINTTHDIRSPLTLIMDPLKKLKARITDPESQKDIDTIDRNARRLQTLVSQILDKRKIDKNQLKLHCRKTELGSFVGNLVSLYQYHAKERGITLVYNHPKEAVDVWVDRSQFDKVIANLLSNAFKYTPDGGEITIDVEAGQDVTLRVSDTGSGISPAILDKIFERFYQGDNSRQLHVAGTGIGLSLCQVLTQMHGGKITAGNRTDGKTGAVFTVVLPKGNAHLKPDQIEQEPDGQKDDGKRKSQGNRNIRVMLVDDDTELANYIKQSLSDWYRMEIYPNGKEALHALLIKPYDIVVSDVVMPEMDGITLVKNIKGNAKISDIPVILLTSQSEVADRLEGLRRGADAYIAKPFNMEELHVTIDNLVDNVRRLRGKFSGSQMQADKVEDVQVQGNDDELMRRIMESINKNLSDPDFNVEKLCEDIAVSRTQLHRKMKELTGISTGDFIRNIRLEQAARLIKEGKINVTQVAYAVGFSNPGHFTTVFKKHFGMTPTEYANKKDGQGQ